MTLLSLVYLLGCIGHLYLSVEYTLHGNLRNISREVIICLSIIITTGQSHFFLLAVHTNGI